MGDWLIKILAPWVLPFAFYYLDRIDAQTFYIVGSINFFGLKLISLYAQNVALKKILTAMFCELNKDAGITKEFWDEIKAYDKIQF